MKRRTYVLGLATLILGSSGLISSGAFTTSGLENGNWVQTSDIDEEQVDQVRVRTIVDPDTIGHRLGGLDNPEIGVVESSIIEGDDDGLLNSINFESINDNSVIRVGRTDARGRLQPDQAAFLIANLGGGELSLRMEPPSRH